MRLTYKISCKLREGADTAGKPSHRRIFQRAWYLFFYHEFSRSFKDNFGRRVRKKLGKAKFVRVRHVKNDIIPDRNAFRKNSQKADEHRQGKGNATYSEL